MLDCRQLEALAAIINAGNIKFVKRAFVNSG